MPKIAVCHTNAEENLQYASDQSILHTVFGSVPEIDGKLKMCSSVFRVEKLHSHTRGEYSQCDQTSMGINTSSLGKLGISTFINYLLFFQSKRGSYTVAVVCH